MTRSPFSPVARMLGLAAAAVGLVSAVLRPVVCAFVDPLMHLVQAVPGRVQAPPLTLAADLQARAYIARWVRREAPRVFPQWRMCPSA